MRIPFLKVGFLDMHSAKTLVIAIRLKGVKYKFSEFIVCSEDLGSILGCDIFKISLISEHKQSSFWYNFCKPFCTLFISFFREFCNSLFRAIIFSIV